ncbi:MAG: signal peptidase I, partial [Phycisphaerales bacterium]|nr:signal peptidase I [Phycisphaerales bacterium]
MPDTSEKPKHHDHSAKETTITLLISFAMALVFRSYVVEAFRIPTGSMAPTLLGDHYEVVCNNCAYPFAIGRDNNPYTANTNASAFCPQCEEHQTYTCGPQDVTGGDKILVNKLSYALRDPQRYEVAVFVYPEQPWEHYIKRVIGLPGETLEIKNGDVFVDGARARKPDAIQDALWIPVFDSRYEGRSQDRDALWTLIPEPGRDAKAWDVTDENHPRATP